MSPPFTAPARRGANAVISWGGRAVVHRLASRTQEEPPCHPTTTGCSTAAHAAGLRPASDDDLGALGPLRALGEAVGLLRARGGRLEATALRPAWTGSTRACGPGWCTPPGASKSR
jgi:hypothetical protein